ncbi:MAG: hypothetical protein HY718_02640 [Planctomycetes bacterium]|nr:hypothetical protein [Planctomycetota bacterium]
MSTQTDTTTTTSKATEPAVAVCDRRGPDAARMEAFLRSRGTSARWMALRDLDDVDGEVIAGRTRHVVFVSWRDLLEGIWYGEVAYGRWLAAGTRVDFVDSPGNDASECLATVSRAWDGYQRTRRRRQCVAGLVLSVIAVIAAFVVVRT